MYTKWVEGTIAQDHRTFGDASLSLWPHLSNMKQFIPTPNTGPAPWDVNSSSFFTCLVPVIPSASAQNSLLLLLFYSNASANL